MTNQTEAVNNLIGLLVANHLNQGTTRPPPPPPPHQQPWPPKILGPTFNNSNPLDWLFQANNYFLCYNIAPAERTAFSFFSLTEEALSWYKYLANNNLVGT